MKFWALKANDEMLNELVSKIEQFDSHLVTSGIVEQLRDSYKTYYGDTKIRDIGNEQKALRINHYAALVRSLNALVTSQKISWQAIATNTDVSSMQGAVLANGLLDHYLKELRLDRKFKDAALMASFLKEAWVSVEWNTQLGQVLTVDENQQVIHEGDLEFKLYMLSDIIRDVTKKNSDFDWIITRSFKNKFDLVAQFPEFEQQILSVEMDKLSLNKIVIDKNLDNTSSDLIPFYTFYHKPCASIPTGRMITFVDGKVLTDGNLPYPRIPVIRLSPEEEFNSPFGHSPMMDVLPLQKSIDTLASTILTNNQAFGVQSIVVDKGSGVTVNQVSTGMNFIEVNPNTRDPRPLQLTATSQDSYRFLDLMINQSQLLSGINDAVRGQAGANTSGAALALLSQQALQFANGLQQSYISLSEDVGSLAISILQQYANTKRIANLAGKYNRPLLKEWSSQDLNGVSKVTIESGNALSRTLSGRLQIAQDLMAQGFVQSPEQYLMVLETGRLEPVYEGQSRQLQLIRSENEKLSDGKQVRAIITDDHDSHIIEHASVLSSPEVRENPNSPIVQNTLAHIQEHIQLLKTVDPALLAILKQQAIPQATPVQSSPEVMNAENPIETASGNVNGPQMPFVAGTNQRFKPN